VLKRAIEGQESFLESIRNPWPAPRTIAGGLADDILFDGHTALPAIRETGGCAIAVSDAAIVEAARTLARVEGLGCELCAAVTVAALTELRQQYPAAEEICCVLSGAALKDMAFFSQGLKLPEPIPADLEAVARLLRE
jgi:threonine synthase